MPIEATREIGGSIEKGIETTSALVVPLLLVFLSIIDKGIERAAYLERNIFAKAYVRTKYELLYAASKKKTST